MFGRKVLEIPNTLKCLAKYWLKAEESLRNDINSIYPEADEEFITRMFHGKYSAILKIISEQKLIENAFLNDLKNTFPELDIELNRIANRLIAEFSLHKRATERITGGDIGLLIIRPNVELKDNYLKIFDYRSGLLCQAKLKNSRGKWGKLSNNQLKVLQDRLSYFALVLYSYSDSERRYLNPFKWKICNSAKIDEIQQWLNKDNFTGLLSSDDIIIQLGSDKIGTNDDEIIDKYISPANNPVLVIRITWPDKKEPDSEVFIYRKSDTQVNQEIKLYLHS
jgi:hypothetical protein